MIGLRITVPIASWRRPHAREFLETEVVPPPATCYGALLSLVGEVDRRRHVGCRVTAGLLNAPAVSTVLRTLWRIKSKKDSQGNNENARPDFQQLVVGADLMVWVDSTGEANGAGLEQRVRSAMREPGEVDRFAGWCLGESTHLINDAWLIDDAVPPGPCRMFLVDPEGALTLPRWVDHVGFTETRFTVGDLVERNAAPELSRLPVISPD